MQPSKDRTTHDAVEAVSVESWDAIRAALSALLGAEDAADYGLLGRHDETVPTVQRNRILFHASALLTRRMHPPRPDPNG